jgi:hypothetical protein
MPNPAGRQSFMAPIIAERIRVDGRRALSAIAGRIGNAKKPPQGRLFVCLARLLDERAPRRIAAGRPRVNRAIWVDGKAPERP